MRPYHRYRRRFLLALGRFRRPFAWVTMVAGLVGFIATIPFGITAQFGDEAYWATVLGFLLTFLAGYKEVTDIEFTDDEDPTKPDFPE